MNNVYEFARKHILISEQLDIVSIEIEEVR